MNKKLKITIVMFSTMILCVLALGAWGEWSSKSEYSYNRLFEVRMREKVFFKEGVEVRLIGMIHVAKDSFYKDIQKKLPNSSSEVITLIEGIGGGKNDDQIKYLDYKEVSKEVGLNSQTNYMHIFPNMVRADVPHDKLSLDLQRNISTVDFFIGLVLKYHRNQISFSEVKKLIDEKREDFYLMKYFTSTMTSPDSEIIRKRNDALWEKFKKYEKDKKNIIIPWGSAHLLDVERRLLAEGYSLKDSRSYGAINLLSTFIGNISIFHSYLQVSSLLP